MEEEEPCSENRWMGGQNERMDARALSRGCPSSRYDETRRLHEEKISIQRTMQDTSPQTGVGDHRPVSQSSTCSKTRKGILYGPQMAVSSLQTCPQILQMLGVQVIYSGFLHELVIRTK